MDRRVFLKKALISSTFCNSICCNTIEGLPTGDCKDLPSKLTYEPQLIINNDMHDAHAARGGRHPKDEEEFLNMRLKEMSIYANNIFYSTGTTHLFTHRTSVGYHRINDFIKYLADKNTDPLNVALNYVHKLGKKLFFSLRMNDTHDSTNPKIITDWKKENTSALVGNQGITYEYGGNRWSAMDYAYDVTRRYIFNLLEETVNNYEIDGLELDFMRHPILFKNQLYGFEVSKDQINIINQLIVKIKSLCENAGIKLAVRVPDSLRYNLSIGIDLENWLRNGWIDILSLGGYFHLSKWCSLASLKEFGEFEMYACLSKSRLRNLDNGSTLSEYYWSNEAFAALRANFDGVYLFNVFERETELYRLFNKYYLNSHADYKYSEVPGYNAGYWLKDGEKLYNYW